MLFLLSTLSSIGYLVNGLVGLLFQVLLYTCYMISKKNSNYIEKIIGLCIISIPTSFLDILGRTYDISPMSWFNIVLVLGNIYILFIFMQNNFKNQSISLFTISIMMMILFYSISIIKSFSSVNTFLTISTPLILLFFISTIDKLKVDYDNLTKLYIDILIAFAISLIFQIILYKLLNIEVGNIEYMQNRIAYSSLFSDISFASLYLSSGAIVGIYRFIKNRSKKYLAISILLIIASIITTARTGLSGLFVSIVFLFLIDLFNGDKKQFIKYILWIPFSLIGGVVMIFIIKNLRNGQSLFSLSNRLSGYLTAIEVFKNHKLIGCGIGIDNYIGYVISNITGGELVLPHNILIQNLAQLGIIGTIIISYILIKPINQGLKQKNKELLLMYFSTLVGSIFIPDILNSRFIIIQMILLVMACKVNKIIDDF